MKIKRWFEKSNFLCYFEYFDFAQYKPNSRETITFGFQYISTPLNQCDRTINNILFKPPLYLKNVF